MSEIYPFQTLPLYQQSIFHKWFKKQPQKNAFIEFWNLLASQKDIRKISIEEIDIINTKYNTIIQKKFGKECQMAYRKFLDYCLRDHHLSSEEYDQLAHLKYILNINDSTINRIHNDTARIIYGNNVDQVISDGKVDQKERDFLNMLQTELKLPDEIAKSIYKMKVTPLFEKVLNSTIEDQRLSPEEDKELLLLAKNLGVTIEVDAKTKKMLDEYRLYWLIENGELPSIDVNINLTKNEKCYFTVNAKWYEYKKITKRITYGGPGAKIKIAKGLYWRTGSTSVQVLSKDVLSLIDVGTLYLTSRRIIFVGYENNRNIQFKNILDFTLYKNGINLIKDSGKNPFIELSNREVELFTMILGRAIRES